MTIEVTKEELQLIEMCLLDKSARMLENYFNPDPMFDNLRPRCKELKNNCDNLLQKLEKEYANH